MGTGGEAVRAVVISVLVLGAAAYPVLRSPPRDSWPLSTYPMFSSRVDSVADLEIVVALDSDGRRRTLEPRLIGGNDEVIVAGGTVRTAVARGRADELCAEVAARLVERSELVEVLVVTERYDAPAWFRGQTDPLELTEHARCPVPR